MNGYKTGGDWTDITSVGRNEIVFEGRHKDYGAFYIRQRYPNALLLSLMSAIGIMVAGAIIPFVFKVRIPLEPKPIQDYIIKPADVLIHRAIVAAPPPPRQQVHPHLPKNTTPRLAPPVITNTASIDTTIVDKPGKLLTIAGVGSPGVTTGAPNPGSAGITTTPLAPDYSKPVIFASTMPKFPGGKIDDYLAHQLQYPAEEAKSGIQGTVYASFIVERDGSVSSVTLLHGINNGDALNREALRVLSGMPKWIPGKQGDHPVRVQFVVPIHFKLQ